EKCSELCAVGNPQFIIECNTQHTWLLIKDRSYYPSLSWPLRTFRPVAGKQEKQAKAGDKKSVHEFKVKCVWSAGWPANLTLLTANVRLISEKHSANGHQRTWPFHEVTD